MRSANFAAVETKGTCEFPSSAILRLFNRSKFRCENSPGVVGCNTCALRARWSYVYDDREGRWTSAASTGDASGPSKIPVSRAKEDRASAWNVDHEYCRALTRSAGAKVGEANRELSIVKGAGRNARCYASANGRFVFRRAGAREGRPRSTRPWRSGLVRLDMVPC